MLNNKNKFKVNRTVRKKFINENVISLSSLKDKNYDRLLSLAKYVRYLNLLPKRKVKLWIKNLKLAEKIKRKINFRKMYFNFLRSKRELKRLFFVLKKIYRKRQIKIKRKLLRKKVCLIMFKKTNTNFFIILTDLEGRVITYSSAGMFSYSTNSKKKKFCFFSKFNDEKYSK